MPNNSNIASIKLVKEVKKMLEGLDPDNNLKDRKTYEAIRKRYIGHFEDQRHPEGTTYVYDDKTGKRLQKGQKAIGLRTVAIGFNMDRNGAKKEWDKAFAPLLQSERADFNKVKNAECELTKTQMMVLFNSCVKTREETLKVHFKGTWEKLLPNERIVIESVKYNTRVIHMKNKNHKWHKYNSHSTVIGGQSNFHKSLDKYVKAKEEGRFEEALDHLNTSRWELRYRSNPEKIAGIANRREAEELTLNTYDIPIYTPLKSAPAEVQKKINETIEKLKSLESTQPPQNDSISIYQEHINSIIDQDSEIDDNITNDERVKKFVAEVKNKINTLIGVEIIGKDDEDRIASFLHAYLRGKGYSTKWEINSVIHKRIYFSGYNTEKYAIERSEIVDNAWDKYMVGKLPQNQIAQSFIGAIKSFIDGMLGENRIFSRSAIRNITAYVSTRLAGKGSSTLHYITKEILERITFLKLINLIEEYDEFIEQLKGVADKAWDKYVLGALD